MVTIRLKVVIDNDAKIALKEAYQYIKKDSLQNAEKVKVNIHHSLFTIPSSSSSKSSSNPPSRQNSLLFPLRHKLLIEKYFRGQNFAIC